MKNWILFLFICIVIGIWVMNGYFFGRDKGYVKGFEDGAKYILCLRVMKLGDIDSTRAMQIVDSLLTQIKAGR